MSRVTIVPLDPVLLDLSGNVERSVDAIDIALRQGSDIIVLPELTLSGYMLADRAELEACAIDASHPVFERWRRLLEGTGSLLVAGFAERAEQSGVFYISAVAMTGSGVAAVYRKSHLWNREKLLFVAGDKEPPIIETRHGRVGVLICYDIEFPEMPRALALRGADLVAVPTNWALADRPANAEAPQLTLCRAAARASHIFVAAADRSGSERGQAFTNGSSIIDPEGWTIRCAQDGGPVSADVDLRTARNRQLSPVNDVLADRRPELYRSLSSPAQETGPAEKSV